MGAMGMRSYRIIGGKRLQGNIHIHGAKNAVLPILAASVLGEECTIRNCPQLSDVTVSCRILEHLGIEVRQEGDCICTKSGEEGHATIPCEWMHAMRSSILFLGGMLGRFGEATLCMPGGCSLGPRPIDLHLRMMEALGAAVQEEGDTLRCTAPHGLHGARLELPFPSVGATENALIAACAACGESILIGAAQEPEVTDLIRFLNGCGAIIDPQPDGTILIEGRERLSGGEHTVIPDRIAAATYLCAAAVTGGEVTVFTEPHHLQAPLAALRRAGYFIHPEKDAITLMAPERAESFGMVTTLPYPGFPTDLQAVFMAAACCTHGITTFSETIFESRYAHVAELCKMGADITVMGRTAVVAGVPRLYGAALRCTDLRGGAAVVLAALAAEGESTVTGIEHIERGYAGFVPALRHLGADITLLE